MARLSCCGVRCLGDRVGAVGAVGVDQGTWAAFCMLLERLCELQADDRGFTDLTSAGLYAIDDITCMQNRVCDLGTQLLQRGQREKVIRPDLTPEDLYC